MINNNLDENYNITTNYAGFKKDRHNEIFSLPKYDLRIDQTLINHSSLPKIQTMNDQLDMEQNLNMRALK